MRYRLHQIPLSSRFHAVVIPLSAISTKTQHYRAAMTHTDQRWILLYVQRWLIAPLQRQDGSLVARDRGSPQGSLCSAEHKPPWGSAVDASDALMLSFGSAVVQQNCFSACVATLSACATSWATWFWY
jgi:hypothetical protein